MHPDHRTGLFAKWLAIAAWAINIPSCGIAGLDRYDTKTPIFATATFVVYISFILACWFSIRWVIAARRAPKPQHLYESADPRDP